MAGILALIAAATSTATGVALRLGGSSLARRSAAAQSRLLLLAALAPLAAVLAFSAGWTADLLRFGGGAHRCIADNLGAWPAPPVLALVALLAPRALLAAARGAGLAWRARGVKRRLEALARPGPSRSRVFALAEPQAFVLGLFRPTVYVSEGLVEGLDPRSIEALLAHEAAHARRFDPLRRFAASVAAGLHLPGVAPAIERRLALAQELAADTEAGRAVGDRLRVAEVLVRVARLGRPPALGLAPLLGSDLEARVRALLEAGSSADSPRPATLGLGLVAAFGLAIAAGAPLHNLLEGMLAFLRS
jgi:Zn-dependent protease with chaperone function